MKPRVPMILLVFPAMVASVAIPSCPVAAQALLSGTSYMQTFDSLSAGIPAGWSVDTGATATSAGADVTNSFFYKTPAANTGWSNTSGHFKNVASGDPYSSYAGGGNAASQAAQTNRALGLRQTAGTDARTAFIFCVSNTIGLSQFSLSFSLQSLDSTAGRTSSWMVDYATGVSPAVFTPVATTGNTTTGGHRFSKETIVAGFGNALDNRTGPVWIRIVSLSATSGAGSRTTSAIDNFHLTWDNAGVVSYIPLLGKMPEGTGISPVVNELKLQLGRPVQPGSGQVALYKAGNPVPVTFDVTGPSVHINDSTVTVTGVTLENNTAYYVLAPAGCFTDSISGLSNQAINDTAYWTFTTADTLPSRPVRVLDETFSTCSPVRMGSFTGYSVRGAAVWHCTSDGHNDDNAVSVNGGIAAGSSEANEDWLISADALDFSAMTNPVLRFWQKRKFDGNTTRSIKLSTTYRPGMSPSEASWKTLQAGMDTAPQEDVWTEVSDIGLNAYKGTPFYLAFTYACGSNGAYELSYDDISVTDQPLGIQSPAGGGIQAAVIEASATGFRMGIQMETPVPLTIYLLNANGQLLSSKTFTGKTGYQVLPIGSGYFASGLYLVRITSGRHMLTLKAMVF